MIELRDHALIGHRPERAALAEALSASRAGTGRVVTLVGDAGIGKSSVCREVARSARASGVPTLVGRAVETGASEPFRPLIEALAVGLRGTGPPEDPSLLPYRGLLGLLLPGWARDPLPAPSVAALSEAVLRLLAVIAGDGGAVLILEDLHGADDDLLAVVEYLADNADAHGTCCIVTLRPDPPTTARLLARRLADRRAARLLELAPLSPGEVDALVLELLQSDALPEELLTFVRSRADGVPFVVEELLVGLTRCGALISGPHGWQLVPVRLSDAAPPTPGGLVSRRCAELSERSRIVVAAAALLDQSIVWPLLPGITGFDEATVLAALREATYAGLLVDTGSELRFRHALTREHVLATLLPPERADLAARTLTAVTAAYPALPGRWCDLGAELAELSGDRTRAAELQVISADRAQQRGALSTAVARLERAVGHLAPSTPLWTMARCRLAEVRALAGDVDGALRSAAEAERSPAHTAPLQRIDVQLAVGRALLVAGDTGQAAEHARRARAAANRHDRRREAQANLLAADVAIADQDLTTASRLAATVRDHGPPEAALRCEALELLGRCARIHDVSEAERLFSQELGLAEDAGLVVWRARALHELGTIDLLDRMRTDRLVSARRAGIEAGAPAIAAVADLHLAAALVAQGRPVEARDAARRSEALAGRLGHAVAPWATMLIARTFAHERRADEAEAAIARALARTDDPALASQADGHVRAMLALHLADRDAARSALDRAAGLLREVPGHHDPHRGLWALLRTLTGVGDAAARREVAEAAGSDTRFNRALLAVAEAVAAGRSGDPQMAQEHYHRGLRTLDGYERPELIHHLTAWLVAPAALEAGWGDPVSQLQHGLRWFAAEGHEPLATSCRAILRDAGATVPRRGRGRSVVPGPLRAAGVTSREVDVLWLVGKGLSNPQVAERLVLSPRTVEKHVAALLRKTGATDRTALATLATRLAVSADANT
jgi:DNA-binding CsgD family transcriptional regulator